PAPSTTLAYTLSLHDALPIYSHDARPLRGGERRGGAARAGRARRYHVAPGAFSCSVRPLRVLLLAAPVRSPQDPGGLRDRAGLPDRKSTRLNSSHVSISYAVF